jgi:hypothetical protein
LDLQREYDGHPIRVKGSEKDPSFLSGMNESLSRMLPASGCGGSKVPYKIDSILDFKYRTHDMNFFRLKITGQSFFQIPAFPDSYARIPVL